MTDFDRLAGQVFNHTTNLFGEVAVWLVGRKKHIEGKILFKNPTEPVQIGQAENYEYRPYSTTIEYYEGTFDGLKKSVDSGKPEYIKVRDRKYLVESITTKYDGKTYVAHLEEHED